MSGILAVYALVISVLIANDMKSKSYSLFAGFMHLSAGLSVGLTGLAAGYAIGIVGDMVHGTSLGLEARLANIVRAYERSCDSRGYSWAWC
jgi:F0F1-type ATP synthase membrane subunit c/vacuolar-type H+-ATPase subunit K